MSKYFVIMLMLVIFCQNVIAETENEQLTHAKAFLEYQSANIENAIMRYSVDEEGISVQDIEKENPYKSAITHSFTFKNDKKRIDAYTHPENEPNKLELVQTTTFNGKVYNNYISDNMQGSIYTQGNFPMGYDDYTYFFKDGLLSFLNNENLNISTVILDDKEMVSFGHPTDNGFGYREVVLNPQANYQPGIIRMRGQTPPHSLDKTSVVSSVYEIKVTNYSKVNDFYFPAEITAAYDVTLKSGKTVRVVNRKVKLEDIKVNTTIDDQIFEIQFPQGTELTHYDYKLSHIVGIPEEADIANLFDKAGNELNRNASQKSCKNTENIIAKDANNSDSTNDYVGLKIPDKVPDETKPFFENFSKVFMLIIVIVILLVSLGILKLRKKK